MNRKIFGVLIIIIGALFLGVIIYFMFFQSMSLSELLSKLAFWRKDEVVEIVDNTNDDNNGNTENYETNNTALPKTDPKRIVVINNGNEEDEPKEVVKVEKSPVEISKANVLQMAGSYAERYGSFSNQSNFSNILDLKIFMSKNMKTWADNYIREQRNNEINREVYYGMTTKTIEKVLKEFDDKMGYAKVIVKTRRRESSVSTGNTSNVFSQDIIIEFIKENGAWKIDKATWQLK